jgi:hypothetical protein
VHLTRIWCIKAARVCMRLVPYCNDEVEVCTFGHKIAPASVALMQPLPPWRLIDKSSQTPASNKDIEHSCKRSRSSSANPDSHRESKLSRCKNSICHRSLPLRAVTDPDWSTNIDGVHIQETFHISAARTTEAQISARTSRSGK